MLKKLSIVCIASLFLAGCATNKQKDKYLGNSAAYIYASGHNYLADDDYNDAISAFESLNSQYPFSSYSQKGDLEIIYAYYIADQQPMALAAAERYLKLYPNSQNAGYAYYMLGVIDFNNGRGFLQRYFPYDMAKHDAPNYINAYNNFKTVVTDYPKSRYASDARRRMMFLINTLADYQYLAGQYYYKRGAYVAALARAQNVINDYSTSPIAEQALELSIQSYTKLGLYNLAATNYKVLKYNFPKSKFKWSAPDVGNQLEAKK